MKDMLVDSPEGMEALLNWARSGSWVLPGYLMRLAVKHGADTDGVVFDVPFPEREPGAMVVLGRQHGKSDMALDYVSRLLEAGDIVVVAVDPAVRPPIDSIPDKVGGDCIFADQRPAPWPPQTPRSPRWGRHRR